MPEPTFFRSAAEFRAWLVDRHDKTSELWIGFYKKTSGLGGITYQEALDQALCFGWIDGVRKTLDDVSYTMRFAPRRDGTAWSLVNIDRVRDLVRLGLMHPAGLAAFRAHDEKRAREHVQSRQQATFDAPTAEAFRASAKAWAFFQSQPPGYRRIATWWVTSAKREETRRRRLAVLIDESGAGRRLDLLKPARRSP